MKTQRLVALGLASLILMQIGCCSWWRHDQPPGPGAWQSQPAYPGTASSGANPEILTPSSPSGSTAPPLPPPGSSGYAPPSGMYIAPPHNHPGVPPSLLPPQNAPAQARFFGPPAIVPADGRTPMPPAQIHYPPGFQTPEPPLAPTRPPTSDSNNGQPKAQSEPGVRNLPPALLDPQPGVKPATVVELPEPAASPLLPVGIARYAQVKNGIFAGLRPDPEGIEWLKANGFGAVLHLRKAGTPSNADQELIEKRGLKYLTLDIAPETLSAVMLDQFNKMISDSANQPLFVYDKDGTLAGVMWYLHFRFVDRIGPELARAKGEQFGLKPADSDERKALWIAIQRIALP